MKKWSRKFKKHLLSLQRKKIKDERRKAGRKRFFLLRKKIQYKVEYEYLKYKKLKSERAKIVYAKRKYDKKGLHEVSFSGEVGIENNNYVEKFLDYAENFIEFDARLLMFNLEKVEYIWPSAITLLCSLSQWVELTSRKNHRPQIASSSSKYDKVNYYLNFSGFYDYVKRKKDSSEGNYDRAHIVKIEREVKLKNLEKRQEQVINLIRSYSILDDDEVELFENVVMVEVFNNVVEHGVTTRDKGYWLIAQYHENHRIISLNIADNGIGIRNSLMTGPQKDDIAKEIKDIKQNDGRFIKLACKENVSGAIGARRKEERKIIRRHYAVGSRRGNGLERIKKTCSKLNIPFAILSHYGYFFVDGNGKEIKVGSREKKIFAGTLYHFEIKAK